MYLIAVTGTAQQIINTAELPVLSKILNKSMVTKGLALISPATSKTYSGFDKASLNHNWNWTRLLSP